jgi:hypothetical protein
MMLSCCSNVPKLSDICNQPIEFRKFKQTAPIIGTKWICPSCEAVYFASYKRYDTFWEDLFFSKEEIISGYYNDYMNKFTYVDNNELKDTGFFVINLISYNLDIWEKSSQDEETQLSWIATELIF